MRPLFKNDIIRLAKDIKEIRIWSVYFLLYNEDIVYVGCSEMPYTRICTHIRNFDVDKYHLLHFGTKEEALSTEKHYIKSFKPIRNTTHNDNKISIEEKIANNQSFEESKILKIKDMLAEKEMEEKNKIAKQREIEERGVIETNLKINIPKNSYIKKDGIYYLKIEDTILRMQTDVLVYKGKTYKMPDKTFGNTNDLIVSKI